jgi:quercetin dioxygenase-like cupin family protein
MTATSTVLAPGDGQRIWQLGNVFTVKAGAAQTQGRFVIAEQVCTGAPPPMHVHEDEVEAFYLLSGTVDLFVGEEVHHAVAGTFCLVPPGVSHSFTSTGDEPARLLVLVAPAGFERFLAAVEERFPEAQGMPDPAHAGAVLGEIAAQHSIRITGPPPHTG